MARGLHYRRGHVAIPYREYPYRYVRTPIVIWAFRIRAYWLCRRLGWHRWKLSTGWQDCGIPDRVICRRCGVWMVQDNERMLRGRS